MEHFKIYAWGECPFCIKAKALLLSKGFEIEYIVLDHASELLKLYKSNYNMTTVPIIVHCGGQSNDKVIGGYTDLVEYFRGSSEGSS
jgi:glutaredoxin